MASLDQLVRVDRSSPVPQYFQVAQALQRVIESGELPPGTRLDNEFSLADQLGVSRPTVRQALQYLMAKGLLARKRGVGTSVAADKVRRRTELTSLHDDLEQAGRHPRTTLLEFATFPARPEIATALALEAGAPVLSLRRLRYADDVPLAILRNHVRCDLGIPADGLIQQGLYQLLRTAGVDIASAEQSVSARPATATEATLLEQKRGATLLVLDRTAYSGAGTPLEHGHDLCLASLYTLEMSIKMQ